MAGLSGAANAALLILLWAAGAAATDFCSTSPAINAPICGASPSLTSCNVPTSLNRNPGFLLGVKSNGQAGSRGTFINNSQDRAACCAACQAKANCDAWQVLEFLGCYHISSSDCSDQTFGPRSQGFVDYYGTGGTLAQARCNPGELSGHTPYVCVCREYHDSVPMHIINLALMSIPRRTCLSWRMEIVGLGCFLRFEKCFGL